MQTNNHDDWDLAFLTRLIRLINPTRLFGESFNPVFVRLVDHAQYEVTFSVHYWEGTVIECQRAHFSGFDARLHAFEFAHNLPQSKTVFNLTIDKDPVAGGQS